MSTRPCSLVLAAHGSLATGNSNQTLQDLADSISNVVQPHPQFATRAVFDFVRPAFLQGKPAIASVLESLPAGDVVVVPVMTSEGYYFNKLPSIFRENANVDDFRLFITPVVGKHPALLVQINHRIAQLMSEYSLTNSETTVVVVGHGTRRNQNSGQSTVQLINDLASRNLGLRFESAFLDQDPTVDDVAAKVNTRHTLVIPFLISPGPHATQDVPRPFGLSTATDAHFPLVRQTENGFCICDLPVGMYPAIADVCLDLASQAISTGDFDPASIVGATAS